MLRVVHVNQRAQPHLGGQLFLREIVLFGGCQQRARLVDPQVVVPLDIHDVGVLGDGPEPSVRRAVDEGYRRMGTQMCQRRVQPRLVGRVSTFSVSLIANIAGPVSFDP